MLSILFNDQPDQTGFQRLDYYMEDRPCVQLTVVEDGRARQITVKAGVEIEVGDVTNGAGEPLSDLSPRDGSLGQPE